MWVRTEKQAIGGVYLWDFMYVGKPRPVKPLVVEYRRRLTNE